MIVLLCVLLAFLVGVVVGVFGFMFVADIIKNPFRPT